MKKQSKKYAAVAFGIILTVCVAAVCIGIFAGGLRGSNGDSGNVEEPMVEEGVYIPRMDVTKIDYKDPGYIEYNGRIYREFCDFSIDEYGNTPKTKYIGGVNEGVSGITGNVNGDVYSVEGLDEDAIVCVDEEYYNHYSKVPRLYFNDNGISLRTGKDWFGDCLNAKGNIEWVSCGRLDVYYEAPPMFDESKLPKVDKFIEALYESPFVYCDDINIDGAIAYFVDIGLTNGITFRIQLVEGGYVLLKHNYLIWDNYPVCIKMDHPIFDKMLDLCWPPRKGGVSESGDFCVAPQVVPR